MGAGPSLYTSIYHTSYVYIPYDARLATLLPALPAWIIIHAAAIIKCSLLLASVINCMRASHACVVIAYHLSLTRCSRTIRYDNIYTTHC
jgi:hypothetical protein